MASMDGVDGFDGWTGVLTQRALTWTTLCVPSGEEDTRSSR